MLLPAEPSLQPSDLDVSVVTGVTGVFGLSALLWKHSTHGQKKKNTGKLSLRIFEEGPEGGILARELDEGDKRWL